MTDKKRKDGKGMDERAGESYDKKTEWIMLGAKAVTRSKARIHWALKESSELRWKGADGKTTGIALEIVCETPPPDGARRL